METKVQTIGCTIADTVRDRLEARLLKLSFAESLLVRVECVITQEGNEYQVEFKMNFRGMTPVVIKDSGYNLDSTINLLWHKVVRKAKREKEKKQDH